MFAKLNCPDFLKIRDNTKGDETIENPIVKSMWELFSSDVLAVQKAKPKMLIIEIKIAMILYVRIFSLGKTIEKLSIYWVACC